MINSLNWESINSTGFGACIFFKCDVINKDVEYYVLGRYVDFQTGSYVANYHYREIISRN